MTTGRSALFRSRRIVVGAIAVLVLSSCQDTASSKARTFSETPSDKPASPPSSLSDQTVATTPVYIDLGPIETVNLSTVTVPSSSASPPVSYSPLVPHVQQSSLDRVSAFDRPVPATEAITTQQLQFSSAAQENPFDIEQPAGTLADRCDPEYRGGIPSATLHCGDLVITKPFPREVRRAQPGAYIRLTPQRAVLVQDADLILREGERSNKKFSDEALGAILIIDAARPSRTAQQIEPDLKDFSAEEGVDTQLQEGTVQPFLPVPGPFIE